METEFSIYECLEKAISEQWGMTKIETFAMNAPECPPWFKLRYIENNKNNPDLVVVTETGYDDAINFTPVVSCDLTMRGDEMCYFSWRIYFATSMIEHLNCTKKESNT